MDIQFFPIKANFKLKNGFEFAGVVIDKQQKVQYREQYAEQYLLFSNKFLNELFLIALKPTYYYENDRVKPSGRFNIECFVYTRKQPTDILFLGNPWYISTKSKLQLNKKLFDYILNRTILNSRRRFKFDLDELKKLSKTQK